MLGVGELPPKLIPWDDDIAIDRDGVPLGAAADGALCGKGWSRRQRSRRQRGEQSVRKGSSKVFGRGIVE
jgi:hypothetical protein